jgi:hypothetical protein
MTATPRLKTTYLVDRRTDWCHHAFNEHWTTAPAALAPQLPRLLSCSINLSSSEQKGRPPGDGSAKPELASWEVPKAAWASPAGQGTAEDGARFIARAGQVVDERSVVAGPTPLEHR